MGKTKKNMTNDIRQIEDELFTKFKASCSSFEEVDLFFKNSADEVDILPKASQAILIRRWINYVSDSEILSAENIVLFCKMCIEWSIKNKRQYLKNRLQLQLAWIYLKYIK